MGEWVSEGIRLSRPRERCRAPTGTECARGREWAREREWEDESEWEGVGVGESGMGASMRENGSVLVSENVAMLPLRVYGHVAQNLDMSAA